MESKQIEELIKKFRWQTLGKMYGCAHSSIIGFISTEWINLSPKENSILDGAPSPIIGRGRKGQTNADIILCKGDKPFIPVEVETNVNKYVDKLNSLFTYLNNKEDYAGVEFGLLFMKNLCQGDKKYKHNWDDIKTEVKKKKNFNIALVSIIKEKENLNCSPLDQLRKRNDYYPWVIKSIDYWIHDNKGNIKEGNLWRKPYTPLLQITRSYPARFAALARPKLAHWVRQLRIPAKR